jgi:polyferredoxin
MNQTRKKKVNHLKRLRVLLAIFFFAPVLLYFVDFTSVLPQEIHALLHLQIVPAILSGAAGVVAFQLILVLVFGRIYCSALCPAGILQDIVNRLFCIGKKKGRGARRFAYHKAPDVLRYALLGLTTLSLAAGFTTLLVWLDPYSNFGRIATNLFRPAAMWGNNLLADLLMRIGNYALYHVTIRTVTWDGLGALPAALATAQAQGGGLPEAEKRPAPVRPPGSTQAVHMAPQLGTLTIPQVEPELCIGCGGCESICPVNPLRPSAGPVRSLPAAVNARRASQNGKLFF